MNEERFFIMSGEYDCIRDRKGELSDIFGHYRDDNLREICQKLNDFNNEVMVLRATNMEYEDAFGRLEENIQILEKENEDLKIQRNETIDMLSREINSSEKAFEGLMRENRRLKERLDYKIASENGWVK